ncbi:hypothetical protein ACOSP7_004671 [Xanthoceras sorbifolium]
MDSKDITWIYNELVLNEEENNVVVFDGPVREAGEQKVPLSLAGKILATIQVNREAFKVLIDPIWKTLLGITTEDVGGNMFVFHFHVAIDRKRVLLLGILRAW